MLSGHTHGGQLCLPGGIPIKLEAVLPRSMGAGMWRHAGMTGYTSVGAGTSLIACFRLELSARNQFAHSVSDGLVGHTHHKH